MPRAPRAALRCDASAGACPGRQRGGGAARAQIRAAARGLSRRAAAGAKARAHSPDACALARTATSRRRAKQRANARAAHAPPCTRLTGGDASFLGAIAAQAAARVTTHARKRLTRTVARAPRELLPPASRAFALWRARRQCVVSRPRRRRAAREKRVRGAAAARPGGRRQDRHRTCASGPVAPARARAHAPVHAAAAALRRTTPPTRARRPRTTTARRKADGLAFTPRALSPLFVLPRSRLEWRAPPAPVRVARPWVDMSR
jgi:hypothetical protein